MFICGIEECDVIVYKVTMPNDKFTTEDVQRHMQYLKKGGSDIWMSPIQMTEILIYTESNHDKAQQLRQVINAFISDDAINDKKTLLLRIGEYVHAPLMPPSLNQF